MVNYCSEPVVSDKPNIIAVLTKKMRFGLSYP